MRHLELITRIELSLEEELEFSITGELPERIHGYVSGKVNPEAPQVGRFLTQSGLPWKPEYIPMFIYADDLPTHLSDARVGAFGHPFRLCPSRVLPDIELVCCGDIQDAVKNGWPLSSFTDLRDQSDDKKKEVLLLNIDKALRAGASDYAEARMYRPLNRYDIIPV